MQVLAYVQTKRITSWKNLVHGSGMESFVYGSKDGRTLPKLKQGDILWVVASTKNRHPALTARVAVDACGDVKCERVTENSKALALLNDKYGRFPYVVTGGSGSSFYGINDAGAALMKLSFRTATGRRIRFGETTDQWDNKFGQYLQRQIQIDDATEENPLEDLAERCQNCCVFISWKHMDHPRGRFPREVAQALVESGFSVWLDLLALPASRYLGQIRRDPEVLGNLLKYGYRQSRFLLALHSKSYGIESPGSDRNWTKEEWKGCLDPDSNERIRIMASSTSNLPSWCENHLLTRAHTATEIAHDVGRIVQQSTKNLFG